MKLFAYQPRGHGQYSFFTIAETQEEAFKTIDAHIQRNFVREGQLDYFVEGWGTDYYQLTVSERGHVIINDNE